MTFYRNGLIFVILCNFSNIHADSIGIAEQNRLLSVASAAYESNIESLKRGRFNFTLRRIDLIGGPEQRLLPNIKSEIGQGFYVFDRNLWHYRIRYQLEDLRANTSRTPTNQGFRTRRTLFPVDIVSDGAILIEHLERYDVEHNTIRHHYQVRNNGIEEFGSLIHFPLRLGMPSSKSQGLLADLDRVKQKQGVTIDKIDTEIDGGQRSIRIYLRSSDFIRTYYIDVNRGGIPFKIIDEATGFGKLNAIKETIYSDIREYPGIGWFPHRMIVRNIGQNELEMTLQNVEFEPKFASEDFLIRSDIPISLSDSEVKIDTPERRTWSISDVRLARKKYPRQDQFDPKVSIEPMPGPVLAWDYRRLRFFGVFALLLGFVLLAWLLRSRTSRNSVSNRAGFTIIEILIVIMIIGVIVALLLPAIQSARESARRATCSNRMKQIGLALSLYENCYRTFPGTTYLYKSIDGEYNASYSVHAHILNFLEIKPLYDSINFSMQTISQLGLIANRTAMGVRVDSFLCPSDSSPKVRGFGRSNFRFSSGPSPDSIARDLYFRSGMFGVFHCTTSDSVTDGLSNTIALSERVQGSWDLGRISPFADYKGLYKEIYADRKYDVKRAFDFCRELPDSVPFETRSGESWMITSLHSTTYNHVFVPNATETDCSYLGAQHEDFNSRFVMEGIISARSFHSGGVNVGFADSHVSFVRSGIDLSLWRALSTRNQGEPNLADSY